jgi:hypothetical protein
MAFVNSDILWDALKYASLSLVAGFVILLVCGKFHVFRRENAVWNKLAYLYYLYIPAVVTVFAFVYGAAVSTGQTGVKLVSETVSPMVSQYVSAYLAEGASNGDDSTTIMGRFKGKLIEFDAYIKSGAETKNMKKDLLAYIDTQIGATTDSGAKIWRSIPASTKDSILDASVDLVEEKMPDYSAELLNSDDTNVAEMSGKLAAKFASSQVEKKIKSFQHTLMLLLALALLIPLGDIVCARVLARRKATAKRKAAALEEQASAPTPVVSQVQAKQDATALKTPLETNGIDSKLNNTSETPPKKGGAYFFGLLFYFLAGFAMAPVGLVFWTTSLGFLLIFCPIFIPPALGLCYVGRRLRRKYRPSVRSRLLSAFVFIFGFKLFYIWLERFIETFSPFFNSLMKSLMIRL